MVKQSGLEVRNAIRCGDFEEFENLLSRDKSVFTLTLCNWLMRYEKYQWFDHLIGKGYSFNDDCKRNLDSLNIVELMCRRYLAYEEMMPVLNMSIMIRKRSCVMSEIDLCNFFLEYFGIFAEMSEFALDDNHFVLSLDLGHIKLFMTHCQERPSKSEATRAFKIFSYMYNTRIIHRLGADKFLNVKYDETKQLHYLIGIHECSMSYEEWYNILDHFMNRDPRIYNVNNTQMFMNPFV